MARAVVLGASSGLGRSLATRLDEDGWEVLGIGRRDLSAAPPSFEYMRCDLGDASGSTDLRIRLEQSPPELFVMSAVTYETPAPPRLEDLERMFRVNTLAPYLLLSEYLGAASAVDRRSAVVVNSDSIFHASRQTGVYASSKAALRVLTTALAHDCKGRNASVASLLLGPIADQKKVADLATIAARRSLPEAEVVRIFLEKSNPSFVVDRLIDLDACYRSLLYIHGLGPIANGMMCRLDGGSAGSLV